MTSTICECGNCSWRGERSTLGCQFDEIPDLLMRISPGDLVPMGGCPECQSLAYGLIQITSESITRMIDQIRNMTNADVAIAYDYIESLSYSERMGVMNIVRKWLISHQMTERSKID